MVKRLKDKSIQEKLLQEFREESRVWMYVLTLFLTPPSWLVITDTWRVLSGHRNIRPHANVVQFLGASSKVPNICIVTEYLPLGDARQLVKSQSIPLKSKLHLLLGIAAGTPLPTATTQSSSDFFLAPIPAIAFKVTSMLSMRLPRRVPPP